MIVACVDFSDITPRVLTEGVSLATALDQELTLLHALRTDESGLGQGPARPSSGDRAERHAAADAELDALIGQLPPAAPRARKLLVEGEPAEMILESARTLGASHLVLGSHGRTVVYDLLAGSVTQAVLRRAHLPVMVVPSAAPPEQ